MRTKTYPSDISRAQFAHILPLLETARRKTKPRRGGQGWGEPARAGIKKIRLARPARDWGAAPQASS